MSLFRIDRNPTRRQLAVFGTAWLLFFGVIGTMVLLRLETPTVATAGWAAFWWSVAVGIPLLGFLVPGLMRWVFLGASYAVYPLGYVVSPLVLAMVYYLVLTPIGLAMRLFGYDPMQRRFDREAETYWEPREEPDDVQQYFRQF